MSYTPSGRIYAQEALAESIRRLGLTAKEIARRLNCSPDSVKNWWSRGNTPSAETLIRAMAEFDQVFEDVCALIGREPDKMTTAQLAAELTRRLDQAEARRC